MLDYLSYSGRYSYIVCPKQYWFRYEEKLVVDTDPRTSIFGISIGKIFEWFYQNRLWAREDKDTESILISCVDDAIDSACLEKRFNPKTDPKFLEEVKSDLIKLIPPSINTIKKFKLLSPNSVSELKLNVLYQSPKYGLSIKLGGRADFVHYKEDGQIWILDGKGTKYREKYVDSEQLIWYAVQHFVKYGKVPDRLGFWFYRFPEDPIQWIEFDDNSLRKSVSDTFETVKKINLKVWNPTPSIECYKCDYKNHCKDGKEFIAAKRSSEMVDNSVFDLERIS
jgi:hypothetical protein